MEWQDQLVSAAVDLARKGYRVFPCAPGEKRPATKNGLKDASRDEGEVLAWWEDMPNANLALNTEDLLVVDFDDPAHPWLRDCPDFGEYAVISHTPSGGRHIFFRLPEGMRVGNSSGRLGRLDPSIRSKIDTRGTGGYVLVWPSRIGANAYAWDGGSPLPAKDNLPMVPAWILRELAEQQKPASAAAGPISAGPPAEGPDVETRARAYLATMEPGISGQGGHNATYTAAVALVNGFALPADRALAILAADFNPRCDPPWTERELAHKIKSAETTPHEKPRGHLRDTPADLLPMPDVDVSGLFAQDLIANADADDAPPAPPSKPRKIIRPFPDELLYVPGLIGAVAEYANATAYKRQPVLALGAAISLMSVLTGRKVRDRYNTRTNLYSVGVCDSGGGKERPRQVNKEILTAASLEPMIGPEGLGSASGLIAAVTDQPAILLQLDEMGRILKGLGDPRGNTHLAHIPTNLIKLYTSANSTYISDAVVDTKRVKKIIQPHCVVWGTTVQKSFYECFNADSLTDGFLSRIMVFESNDPNPLPQTGETQPIPQELVDGAAWWRDFQAPRAGSTSLATFYPQPIEVPYDARAVDRMRDAELMAHSAREGSDEDSSILWTRLVEKARKLALLWACSECPEEPRVTLAAADWAVSLAEHCTLKMIDVAAYWASSSLYERISKHALRIILARGADGMTMTDFGRKFKEHPPKVRREVLQGLMEAGEIKHRDVNTGGRPRTIWYASIFQEEEAAA